MLWECLPLPRPSSAPAPPGAGPPLSVRVGEDDYGPNPLAESPEVVVFPPGIPGPARYC